MVEAYYITQNNERGDEIMNTFIDQTVGELDYYFAQKGKFKTGFSVEKQTNLAILQELGRIAGANKRSEIMAKVDQHFSRFYQALMGERGMN
jgi:hypothetical protein